MIEEPSSRTILFSAFLVGAALCLAISNQSLWIDEGVAVWLASQSSVRGLFSTLNRLNTSDPQMPLYLFYMWFWTRLFGTGEIALRASNIPFALLLSYAFSWASCRLFRSRVLWLLVGLSPFLWVYMNEARPYIPVAGCSTVCVLAAKAYVADRERYGRTAPWICIVSLLLLCASYMLGVFLGAAILVFMALEAQRKHIDWKLILKEWKLPVLTQVPFFLLLGLYYLFTLLRGSGGARGISGPGNIAFALYEFLGFSGLGPPRNELRAHPHLTTLLPYWPWLCIGILAGLGLIFIAPQALHLRKQRSELVSLVAALGVGGTLMVVASILARFQFWGRHCAPLFPLFILSVALLLSAKLPGRHSRLVQLASFVMLLTAWTVSDVRLRLMPRYQKDDYRVAAEIALADRRSLGATIAWVADSATAQYYGLRAEKAAMPVDWQVRGQCLFAANWPAEEVEKLVGGRIAPLILVFSKPDLYDRAGAWSSAVRKFDAKRIATPNAFDIYLFDSR
jgi:hypothetical protein